MRVSVVIRVRDEADALARLLGLLRAQDTAHEVVVVDSGSGDGSAEVARDAGVAVISIPAASFTFGGALNTGTAAASGEVVVALSAHAYPRRPDWLAGMAAPFADPGVACVFGDERDERGRPLPGPVRQDRARFDAYPFWGYSNGAGAFRRSLWEERPFRADLPGSEDLEWARWALGRGYVCVVDPALAVDHDHAKDPLRNCFRRYEREHRAFAMFLDLPPYGARDLAREWWSDQGWHRSRARARLDPRRAARLAGKWRGRRAA